MVVSKILNHVESGVTAVYDRHGYDAEKLIALDAWGQRLEGLGIGKALAAIDGLVRRRIESSWWQRRKMKKTLKANSK